MSDAPMNDTLEQLRAGRLKGAARLDLACGLAEFPREILDLADSLEVLNLTGNRLSALPEDFGRLKKLRILFCSENDFTELPTVIGECTALEMVGFKSNRIVHVPEKALPPGLRWLILTDNRITELPKSIGRCTGLRKLMLAGNRLTSLPEAMAQCTSLELLRLAANELDELPEWLLALPKLSWLAFAGNPCSSPAANLGETLAEVPWEKVRLEKQLGAGASGEIHAARWQEKPVAVKVFKGAMTSDGLPDCEMLACVAAGTHPHLIPVLGRITGHPEGRAGLVMELMDAGYAPLAGPPSLETCTRDVYAEDRRFTGATALEIARGIVSAAGHLHELGILHGDLYAHNILTRPTQNCLLGDFGAASFFSTNTPYAEVLKRIEVRAFGLLLEELLERSPEGEPALKELAELCLSPHVMERPDFAEIRKRLGC